ncbi:hypothetical protein KR067_005645, partial [Drosophila pandora]
SLNLISNWMQVAQVGASPVTITDSRRDTIPRRFCADMLADEINLVCAGQFLSLRDAFPNSFGNRSKRQGTPDGSLTRNCCINKCSYAQLRQYCAPSSEN